MPRLATVSQIDPASTASISQTDPRSIYNVLLLHADASNGSTSNVFVDSSTLANTVAPNGSPAQGAFSPILSSLQWCHYFDGNTSYLNFPANGTYTIGTSDFTIECWTYPQIGASGGYLMSSHSAGGMLNWSVGATGTVGFSINIDNGATSSYFNIGTTSTLTLSAWNHVAVVRQGGYLTIWINGSAAAVGFMGAAITVGSFNGAKPFYIGTGPDTTNPYTGYISNMRFVKGVGAALYTGPFTPPTSPLTAVTNTVMLTCQSNRHVDNSTVAATVTAAATPRVENFWPFTTAVTSITGSMFFNGTTDYLTISTNNLLNLSSTANWTLEAWIYPTAIPAASTYGHVFYGSGISLGFFGPTLYVTNNVGGLINGGTPILNTWNHIALVNVANTSYNLYLNGTRTATAAAASFTSTTTYIGGNSAGGQLFSGYISQAKISSAATYTGTSYTIPTTALTADVNTTLLLSGTNSSITDSSGKNSIASISTTQISTAQKKFGTASLLFNGSSNYLRIPYKPAYSMLATDFTVECWIYATASTNPGRIINAWSSSTIAAASWEIVQAGATSVQFLCSTAGVTSVVSLSGSISLNQWYHLAAVRYGNVFTLYINGTSASTTTQAITLQVPNSVTIGARLNSTAYTEFFTGYIDEVRVSKVARYTSNFQIQQTQFLNS
jgi:hypothetical protein